MKEYVSEKYHIIPKNKFKKMTNRLDFLPPIENVFLKYFKKYFCKVIVSALGVIFLIFHEEIYLKLNLIPSKEK